MEASARAGSGFAAACTTGWLPGGHQRPDERGRLEFDSVRTRGFGSTTFSAGTGPETIVCLHGLGGTKASFLPTVAALADRYRVVALDLPGFGESDKPIGAPYDAPWFARSVFAAMDALDIERAHIAGNSMGGRVAIEAGLTDHERTGGLLLSPALGLAAPSPWAPVLRALRPELGDPAGARPVVEAMVRRLVPAANGGWTSPRASTSRSYLTSRGRRVLRGGAQHLPRRTARGERPGPPRRCCGESLFVWGARTRSCRSAS